MLLEGTHMALMTRRWLAAVRCTTALSRFAPARAESPRIIADAATRYLSLGDGIASGHKAVPVTDGYPCLP